MNASTLFWNAVKMAQVQATPPGAWLNHVGFGNITRRSQAPVAIQNHNTPHPDFNTWHPGSHIDRPIMGDGQ